MNFYQKYFSTCLLGITAFLSAAPFQAALAQTAPSLGAASSFSVLGGTEAVTCTDAVIIGDVGLSPATAFTNTRCTISGGTPPATNSAAAQARTAFLSAYAALAPQTGDCGVANTLGATIPVNLTLLPGVYCTNAALAATGVTLTLDGNNDANAVWIFKIGTQATGALTGTGFSVVMDRGGQPCNVFWAPSAGVTMTDSAFKGNILAGDAIGGRITLTRGSLAGRALANVAVTTTGTSVIGCGALQAPAPGKCDADDDDKDHHDKDHDGDHDKKDKDHDKKDKDHDKNDRDHGDKDRS
jgi:hypothetical protein